MTRFVKLITFFFILSLNACCGNEAKEDHVDSGDFKASWKEMQSKRMLRIGERFRQREWKNDHHETTKTSAYEYSTTRQRDRRDYKNDFTSSMPLGATSNEEDKNSENSIDESEQSRTDEKKSNVTPLVFTDYEETFNVSRKDYFDDIVDDLLLGWNESEIFYNESYFSDLAYNESDLNDLIEVLHDLDLDVEDFLNGNDKIKIESRDWEIIFNVLINLNAESATTLLETMGNVTEIIAGIREDFYYINEILGWKFSKAKKFKSTKKSKKSKASKSKKCAKGYSCTSSTTSPIPSYSRNPSLPPSLETSVGSIPIFSQSPSTAPTFTFSSTTPTVRSSTLSYDSSTSLHPSTSSPSITSLPSIIPSSLPSTSNLPSKAQSTGPSIVPSTLTSSIPSAFSSLNPSNSPSIIVSLSPSIVQSSEPTSSSSSVPSSMPSKMSSFRPSLLPSLGPSSIPSTSSLPSYSPTEAASIIS